MRGWSFFVGLFSFLLVVSCSPKPPLSRETKSWNIEVAGCETWTLGPACAVGKDKLQIWVAGEEAFTLAVDGQALASVPEEVAGGRRIEVAVPASAKKLRLARSGGEAFELALLPSQRPPWYDEVRNVFYSDHPEEVGQRLEEQPQRGTKDLAWRRFFQARFAADHGKLDEAIRLAEEGVELWTQAELPAYAANELVFIGQRQLILGNYPEVRRSIQRAEALLQDFQAEEAQPARPFYLVDHLRASLARSSGDFRSALQYLEELSAAIPRGLLSPVEVVDLQHLHALVLADLGHFDKAAAMLADLVGLLEGKDPKAPRLNAERKAVINLSSGWVALLARQAGQKAEDPQLFFERAWEHFRHSTKTQDKASVLVNMAEVAVLAGRTQEARDYLRQVAPWRAEAGIVERLQMQRLEAQIALLENQPISALELFQRLDLEASQLELAASRWQALVGKAAAQAALGQKAAAIESYERAEKLESRELLFIPVDQGRETFIARREDTTRQHLELLLELKEQARAFALARRHRTQTLRLLDRDERLAALGPAERREWERATAEYQRLQGELTANPGERENNEPRASRDSQVPPPGNRSDQLNTVLDAALAGIGLSEAPLRAPSARPGELTLAFFPLERSWLLFASSGEGQLRVEEAPGRELAEVAPELLGRIVAEIEASRRIRILPWGDLDFHTIKLGREQQMLLAMKTIAYGIDAGPRASEKPAGKRRALLVRNPDDGLSWTASEVILAQQALAGQGFEIGETWQMEEATPAQLRAKLELADYFHFASHSFFYPESSSQSFLALGGGEFNVGDIITLPRVPRQVLLASCSSGQAARSSGVEGLGLAQAFILAGSRQVLAATKAANDRESNKLIAALYRHLNAVGGEVDLAEALRLAQLERREKPGEDWAAFRVFEP